jgi:P4 family phage/plasmid primase-like protien
MYWAKQDAFEEYEKVKKDTIDYYIEETIFEAGDFDYAMVLYHMFKDKFVCTSITNKIWYVFNNHRWELDEGYALRMIISKELFQLYSEKQHQCLANAQNYEPSDEMHEKNQRKIKKIAEICLKMKKTNDKNNIMREAMEIFFDKNFNASMDANPYLLCFTNGVFDFKNKIFRDGYPQDYVTMTTHIPYIKYDIESSKQITEDIMKFMEQLFPQTQLAAYMWEHLASSLIGIKKEHVFNIYRGSGSNGKSILTDLMSQALGDYKGTVPITLVTEKRNAIGGTSSEVMALKGVRYAVMQEPSKDAVINEGVMKELTGGDPLQARALFSNSEIFIPQFSLVVCTNELFEVKSNDDGTWRRMKLIDFISKFISEGETYRDTTTHVFPKDKSLKEKLPAWAPVFISMLVKIACETNGEVKDCLEVISASNKYRQGQDAIAGFINDKIVKDVDGSIGKKILNDVFKEWFQGLSNNRRPPKLAELEEILNNTFGNRNVKTNKWHGIRINYDDETEDPIDNL